MEKREEEHNVPLLGPRPAASAAAENGENSLIRGGDAGGREEEEAGLGWRLLEENRKLWKVAGPSICMRFSGFGVTIISLAFMGHIGATELAAFALVSTVLMRLCNGILDPKIAAIAGLISVWYIPIMFANLCNFALQMYLQAQSKNLIVTYLAFANLGTHLFLSWLLTIKFHFGLAGVMSSMVISLWIPVSGQLIFVFCGACPLTWTGFSSEALTDLFPIIKLSLSSGVMLCLEMWYNTILVLLTGYMKNPEVTLDALSICLNINGWELMISMGFLSATGVRVANELGAGSARRAKFAILNVVTTSFSIGLVLFVFFLLFRGKLSYIFTTSEEVAAAVSDLSPLLAVSILLNSVQPVLSGVAVGAGWQSVVAYVNITTYYLIGIPLGTILGYVLGYHVKGVWVGMLLGTLVQTIVLLFITIRTDWDKQVEVTRQRLNKWYIDGNIEKAASSGSP
ncbi:hypothetical protein ACQ4PT_067721 [Festuca glaucescens]